MCNLCYRCSKGQEEMCDYYKEHFLEGGGRILECPEFEEDLMPEQESLFGGEGNEE